MDEIEELNRKVKSMTFGSIYEPKHIFQVPKYKGLFFAEKSHPTTKHGTA